jgi:hypothetical protein
MSFSASTCLSYTGTTTLTNPISIYSDSDSYLSPFTAITLSQITSGNCPLVLTGIPNGTTTIRLKSANNFCCDIPLTCNDLCTTCDLSFDDYETNNIGRIVAGELTGSCDNNITQYRINWFKDGGLTPVFTSGKGTEFTPYNYTHPLTGITSPIQPSGLYTPVVDRIKINGLNYSQTGGTGFIQANLDCFNSAQIEVEPFDCSNGSGTSNLPQYTHRVRFSGASAGITPLPLTATFNLDPTTNYFAWKFQASEITDSLIIRFNSSTYPNPIILEYWTVGSTDNVTNAGLTTFPKSANTGSYLSKVTSLTALTRNFDDYLTLEVIPNQFNTQTNWDFYFTCLETFTCSSCTDSYVNSDTPYKINKSTISVGSPDSCGKRTISYQLSGCTFDEIYNSNIPKYMFTNLGSGVFTDESQLTTDNSTSLRTISEFYYTGDTSCSVVGTGTPRSCISPPNSNTIGFKKSTPGGIGFIEMTFSNLTDLAAFKSSYDNRKIGWINDPTDFNYYRYAVLGIPNATGSTPCGDDVGTLSYGIHFSSVMTTGGTAPNYTLTMTMPTITNSISGYGPCFINCNGAPQQIVTAVNLESTGTSNNTVGYLISNTGSRYQFPFYQTNFVFFDIQPAKYSGSNQIGYWTINNSLNSTVPFSGNSAPYVQIPSLSSQTCDFSSVGQLINSGTQAQGKYIYIYDYKLVMINPPDLTEFSIKANTIVNGLITSTGYPVTALTYSGGTVTYFDPLYTF